MTFEEWFEQEFIPSVAYSNDDPYKYESADLTREKGVCLFPNRNKTRPVQIR